MPETVLLAPAILFFVYRVLVIVVATWIARPTNRLDIKRFERVLAALSRRPPRRGRSE